MKATVYRSVTYSFLSVTIWYPSIFNSIPLVLFSTALLLVYKIIVDKVITIPSNFKGFYSWISIFIFYSIICFIFQQLLGKNNRIYLEASIYGINYIISPIILLLVQTEKKLNKDMVIKWVTYSYLITIYIAIFKQVGFDLTSFDAQDRFKLPLVINSIASTSIALPLVFIYAANIYSYIKKFNKIFTIITLLIILYTVYFVSNRFAIIVVLITIIYYVFSSLRNAKKGSVILISISCFLLYFVIVYGALEVNSRFTSELDSFKKITDPLSDKSLFIRYTMWNYAISDILQNPLGYGYSNFVATHYEINPMLGKRGFNTHNEWLLQALGVGWLGVVLFGVIMFKTFKRIIAHTSFKQTFPFIVAFLFSSMFETYSNSPLSVNIYPTFFLFTGIMLNSYE